MRNETQWLRGASAGSIVRLCQMGEENHSDKPDLRFSSNPGAVRAFRTGPGVYQGMLQPCRTGKDGFSANVHGC